MDLIWMSFSMVVCLFMQCRSDEPCPESCVCVNTTNKVVCNGKHGIAYTKIPPLPENTTYITFKNHKVANMSRDTFANVIHIKLETIRFIWCDVQYIAKTAFLDLLYIQTLEITGSSSLSQLVVSRSFSSLSRSSIVSVTLNNMHNWTKISDYLFVHLQSTNITNITLRHNNFMDLNGPAFQKLTSLKQLDLNWNDLTDCNFKGLSQLRKLRMARNRFTKIPKFCTDRLTHLNVLDLSSNKFFKLSTPFKCLVNLKFLYLNGLTIRKLYSNIFSLLPSLDVLKLERLGYGLKTIEANAFNSSSLNHLTFSTSGDFKFQRRHFFEPTTTFTGCSNLQFLDISYNMIKMSQSDLTKMFLPLKNLKVLKMTRMKLFRMPLNFGNVLPNLHELYLDDNLISEWDSDLPFRNMTSLAVLSMSYNRISAINESSFSTLMLNVSLQKLYLKGNRFSCSCVLMWFRNWMDTTHVMLIDKDEYLCSISPHYVVDYHPSDDLCYPQNISVIISASLSSFVALMLIIVGVMYFCRWRIRFLFYNLRFRSNNYHLLKDEMSFDYDGYVIYSNDDFLWVKEYMISKLETENNIRLCIRDRDFEIGSIFADNLVGKLRESKYAILILSNEFAKDQWCYFQLSIARHLEIKHGSPKLIPIMLSSIKFQFVNATLYNFISTVNYLPWSTEPADQALLFSKLTDLLKK